MALLVWTNSMSVNIKEIDEQHKRLVDLINQLHDAMKSGKGQEALGKILSELADYTVYHFGTEEKLFKQYGYPEYARHKKAHDDLTKQVMEIKKSFDAGSSVVTVEVMNFLKDWLTKHILDADKKYTPYLNSKGVI